MLSLTGTRSTLRPLSSTVPTSQRLSCRCFSLPASKRYTVIMHHSKMFTSTIRTLHQPIELVIKIMPWGNVWGLCGGIFFGEGFFTGKFSGKLAGVGVQIAMQDSKSACAAVMICATGLTHRHTLAKLLTGYTLLAQPVELKNVVAISINGD